MWFPVPVLSLLMDGNLDHCSGQTLWQASRPHSKLLVSTLVVPCAESYNESATGLNTVWRDNNYLPLDTVEWPVSGLHSLWILADVSVHEFDCFCLAKLCSSARLLRRLAHTSTKDLHKNVSLLVFSRPFSDTNKDSVHALHILVLRRNMIRCCATLNIRHNKVAKVGRCNVRLLI